MRTTGLLVIALLLVGLLGGRALSQDLSTSVFPSEDEIYEALRLGEISFEQYLILQELIFHGLDSTNLHLLDEIPNLSFFEPDESSLKTSLEKEQQSLFSKTEPPVKRPLVTLRGRFRHRYFYFLEEDGDSKYQSSIKLKYKKKLVAEIKLRREFSGQERVISRSAGYKKNQGLAREFIAGNFSRRLGLGTVFGYRGRLMDFSSELDRESFLYPDYGGYNGIYNRWQFDKLKVQSLMSITRDGKHRLTSSGAMVTYIGRRFSPGIIIGVNYLKNRSDGHTLKDYKYGIYTYYKYRSGYNSFEISQQAGEKAAMAGLVTEGRHRFHKAEVKYAGWFYADDYIDLSGGSKAVNIRRRTFLETVDFEYSDKRSGQKGAMFKTIVGLFDDMEIANSLIYAVRNSDTAEVQWFTEVTRKFDRKFSISLDYLTKVKRRYEIDNKFERVKRQTRIEAKIITEKLYLRSSISYNSESADQDFWSVFVNMRYRSASHGRIEIWSNLARVDLNAGVINYWYGYIKNDFYLFDNIETSVKLSHTYRRDSEDRHRMLMSVEVNYLL